MAHITKPIAGGTTPMSLFTVCQWQRLIQCWQNTEKVKLSDSYPLHRTLRVASDQSQVVLQHGNKPKYASKII